MSEAAEKVPSICSSTIVGVRTITQNTYHASLQFSDL